MFKQLKILKDVIKKQRGAAITSGAKKKNTGAQNCGDYFNIFLSAQTAESCFMSSSINQEENGENMLPPATFPI
jgi:hypothetical protein